MSTQAVMVVGAGLMGTGIAHAFLVGGCDVQLIDPQQQALDRAVGAIGRTLDEGQQRGKISATDADAARSRLRSSVSVEAQEGGIALVVETALEDLSVKQGILRNVEPLLDDQAVFATNTSALSITEIAAAAKRPQRVIGMHFFQPSAQDETGGNCPRSGNRRHNPAAGSGMDRADRQDLHCGQ